MDFYKFFLVGSGGLLGSIARYATVRSVSEKIQAAFPYGTLTVNIVGSFILGLVYGLALRKTDMNEDVKLFLGVGFCGGYTTFSSLAWESVSLFNQKMAGTSLLYIGASLATGILALVIGIWLSRFL
ncbi:MAG TPA: fluoride efflux transporter CrcB [Ohtaekwangia sp.]|uniref:fluoride efflux transporter CrcB n=1 Tax=Ohtaekwangia sp. TaxID=2066019 RepID=UPI002F92ABE1